MQVDKEPLTNIPIRSLDNARSDKEMGGRLVKLVEQMLLLDEHFAAVKTPHEKDSLKRQIDATDRQIDKLVYELYGLTDEEIGIVEGRS